MAAARCIARGATDNWCMKTLRFAAVVAIAAFTLFSATPVTAQTTPEQIAKAAPADEYFGPLALSVIGIRNAISQTCLRLDRAGLDDGDALSNVGLVEASVHEWERKYPEDTWLPRTVLALHRTYRRMASEQASLHAVDAAAWLLQKYPNSDEAHALRAELAGDLGSDGEAVTASNR